MPGTLSPNIITVQDANGAPVSGAKLYSYLAGTTTAESTYADSTLSTPNANPVVADSAGRIVAYLDAKSYRFVVTDPDDVQLYVLDPVQGDVAGQAQLGDYFFFGGNSSSPTADTSYPTGATFDKCHAGTAVFSIDSANIPAGTYVLEGMLSGDGSSTITAALVNLSDGSPDTPLATISSNSSAGARQQSGAITFAATGASKDYGIKVKVDTGSGFAWALRLTRTA